jgi:hypothetical protein
VPSNARLPLLASSETCKTNTCLSFFTKSGVSLILNKSRQTEKPSVSFLLSPKPGAHLGDADVSHFTRSETIICGRISNLCILFEFLI